MRREYSKPTIEKDGEPYFVAKDVAEILGYKDTAYAINTHCRGIGEAQTPTPGGPQMVKIIPERDVYRLVMRSKLHKTILTLAVTANIQPQD